MITLTECAVKELLCQCIFAPLILKFHPNSNVLENTRPIPTSKVSNESLSLQRNFLGNIFLIKIIFLYWKVGKKDVAGIIFVDNTWK